MQLRNLFALVTMALVTTTVSGQPLNHADLQKLLSHPDRPSEDAKRDEARKPAEIMKFSGVAEGDNVLDLFSGGGWYTELFSIAVGANGKVYAQNDSVIWGFAKDGMIKRTENNRLPNVQRFDSVEIADVDIAEKSVDIVFSALNYHDLFFTHFTRDGKLTTVREDVVDYHAALAKVHGLLADDGVVVLIDHFAKPGSGYAAPNDVHRIDPDIVKYQMEQAGFKLVEEAFYLRNPQDDLTKNVFDPSIRGSTDRFIYKFMKR